MFSENDKIKLIQAAYGKFADTVAKLLARHRVLFEEIMKEAADRKIEEHRGKIKDIYNSKKNNY